MVVLTLAILGVALSGMISKIAPRPEPQVRPIVHQQIPTGATHIEASTAS